MIILVTPFKWSYILINGTIKPSMMVPFSVRFFIPLLHSISWYSLILSNCWNGRASKFLFFFLEPLINVTFYPSRLIINLCESIHQFSIIWLIGKTLLIDVVNPSLRDSIRLSLKAYVKLDTKTYKELIAIYWIAPRRHTGGFVPTLEALESSTIFSYHKLPKKSEVHPRKYI